MAEILHGRPLPSSQQRQTWKAGSQVSRGGKLIDVEIEGGTINGAAITATGAVLTSPDIDGGTIDGATIATSTITEGSWTATSYNASWTNLGGAWQTGRYRVDSNGVVHIQGMIQSGTTTPGTALFTLPAACRPAADLRLVGFSATGVTDATIQSNGQLIIQSGWSATWTSIHFTWAT